MPFLLFTLLLGCAAREPAVQVDLRGWTTYLEYPVSVSDQELEAGTEYSGHQLETMLWRQERCRLRGLTCRMEVRIFRNRHFGEDHLSADQVSKLLKEAGLKNVSVVEKLAHGVSGGDTCYVVVRILAD